MPYILIDDIFLIYSYNLLFHMLYNKKTDDVHKHLFEIYFQFL